MQGIHLGSVAQHDLEAGLQSLASAVSIYIELKLPAAATIKVCMMHILTSQKHLSDKQ